MIDGILAVNKSPGFSSTQYLEKIKTILNQKLRKFYKEQGITGDLVEKAGHSGTLDPNAAGVLVIFINKATKLLPYISKNKSYIFEVIVGKETDTLDTLGKITKEIKIDNTSFQEITKKIEDLLPSYLGKFTQLTPAYSSKKIKGKKLYELAQILNKTLIEEKTTTVYIYSLKLIDNYYFRNEYRIQLEMDCSQGTYVRSVIKDIGDKIGVPLTLAFLVRKSSNDFTLEEAFTIEEIKNSPNIFEKILKVEDYLNNFPFVIVNDKTVFKVRNGHSFTVQNVIHTEKKGKYNDKNIFVVKDRKKETLAIAYSDNLINFKIKKVLKPY
ncbi:MAG: tRNA pseudouridine(55) synthase TruB [bacterium]